MADQTEHDNGHLKENCWCRELCDYCRNRRPPVQTCTHVSSTEFRCIGNVVDEILSVLAEFGMESECDEWVDELAEQIAYQLRGKGYLANDI